MPSAAAAKADINASGKAVVAHVIRVVAELHAAVQRKGFAVVEIADSLLVICNPEATELRNVGNALWRAEPGNGMHADTFFEIDDLERVIAERAKK